MINPTFARALALLRLAMLAPALFASPSFVAAKAPQVPAAVSDQPWYPPGYRDLRIAAESMMRTFPRDPGIVLWEDWNNPRKRTYDVIDCMLGYDLPENSDWQIHLRERLALDVARMRTELARLGYRPQVYEAALLAHERAALAHFPALRKPPPPVDYEALPDDASLLDAPASDDSASELEGEDDTYHQFWGLKELAATLEANRQRLQPTKPQIIMQGGCGAGEVEFNVALAPPTGRLWLLNAFAFKVCERKVADPWNHQACGWSEFASGDTTIASGRYMYEARWPDGTVRRGAKVLQETEDGSTIVIRRN